MSSNEYMREYMNRLYANRRNAAIEKLGGKCVRCGSKEQLQFDHIDPTTKTAEMDRLWATSEKRINEELRKCQLLCSSCHVKKTLKDLGRISAKESHGTLSSYRYCKCDDCRAANNKYKAEYKRRAYNSSSKSPAS